MTTMFEDLLPHDLRLNYFQLRQNKETNTMEHFYCIIQCWGLEFPGSEIPRQDRIQEFPDPSSPPIPQKILLILHNAALSTTVPSPALDLLLRLQFCTKLKHRLSRNLLTESRK